VQGMVLKVVDPVGLDSSPKQEKADLSGAAVNGIVPDRVLVVPGQKGYTGANAADYEKFRSSATIEYVHDPKALPVELKKIAALLGDGAKPDSKAASEIGYLGAIISGQGQRKDAEGASVNGIAGGTNPDGLEGKGWQAGVGAVQIAGAVGILDALLVRGVGTVIRGIGTAIREVRSVANIGRTFEDNLARGVAKDLHQGEVIRSAVDPNKLKHIFGNPQHALDDLVKAHGGESEAFRAIEHAANKALAKGKLSIQSNGVLPGKDAANIIDVNGIPVKIIGGRVENGTVRIGSVSRKGM
jgi:hypothetical protein